MDLTPMIVRLLCAAGAGALLGIERESHGRAAGLRTTILVTIGPCLGMMLSGVYYADSYAMAVGGPGWHPDPMRLAAGILAGMGFIGAGTILRQGNLVRGVTTASVLWFATLLGLAFGAGCLALGLLGLILALGTLHLLPRLESLILNDWYSVLTLKSRERHVPLDVVQALLHREDIRIKKVELVCACDLSEECVTLHLKHKRGQDLFLPEKLRDDVLGIPGVAQFDWK